VFHRFSSGLFPVVLSVKPDRGALGTSSISVPSSGSPDSNVAAARSHLPAAGAWSPPYRPKMLPAPSGSYFQSRSHRQGASPPRTHRRRPSPCRLPPPSRCIAGQLRHKVPRLLDCLRPEAAGGGLQRGEFFSTQPQHGSITRTERPRSHARDSSRTPVRRAPLPAIKPRSTRLTRHFVPLPTPCPGRRPPAPRTRPTLPSRSPIPMIHARHHCFLSCRRPAACLSSGLCSSSKIPCSSLPQSARPTSSLMTDSMVKWLTHKMCSTNC
jgi:hypothetical protein